MASDPVDHHHLHPSDAASAADHPSTSTSPTAGHRKVKLLCSYGGQILPRAGDGALRYVGGETRIVTLRRDATLPEVLRKMGDVYGGPALFRYQLPDQDLDPLISVSTSDDLENMMEEYDKLTADTPGAKLRVFLFPHDEVTGTVTDSVAPYCALQENVTRYLDAVNGFDSGIRRKDSATSFSSAHNSDGMNASEAAVNESAGLETVINEGTFRANICHTNISAQDALNMVFAMQDNRDVQKAASHSNQPEVLHSIQYEWSPPGINQNSILNPTQAEQPPVAWHMPQFYGDSRHAQMSPQYYAVMGMPPPINVAGASQHTYVPPGHINATSETMNHPRVDPHLGNPNVGNVAKLPSDVNHNLLPQLPPLPSPFLLAPNAERNALRQVGTSSQVLTKRVDCSLCQRSLPHAHSETMLSEQGTGLKTAIPEANKVLQSRLSEDLTRMRATQVPDVGMQVSKGMDTQVDNLTATSPPKAPDFIETVPQMSQDSGRPVVDAASVDMAEILIAPVSMGILSASQPSTGTINNPQRSNDVHSLQKQKEGPTLAMNSDSYGHPNILLGPGSVSITQNPSGTFIIPPQSNVGDMLQHQTQLLQHIGLNVFPMYPVDQDFNNKPFVSDTGLVGKSEHLTNGQTMYGSETTFFHGHARPIDMTMGTVWKNPHGFPGFCDQTRPVSVPDVDTSKYVKPEQPTMVTISSHKIGPQERGNELSVSHPLISNVAVPEGNSVLVMQPSMVSDVAYLQSVQPANTSLIPETIGVHGPYLNHLEAGVGSRGMANYADPAYISNDVSKNPNVERKDETSNFHAIDVPIDKAITQRDNSQFSTMHHANKMDQLQQDFLTGSHASDKGLQNAQGATVLPPRPNNVSKKESISTKDIHSSICPKNNKQSEIVVPTEVASNIQNSQNMDSPKELAYTLKEDVNIKQDIQIYDGRASVTTLQPSEVHVHVPDSYETKDTSPDKECATKESNVAVDCDHTENIKNKQSEKMRNGFPNADEIGHLQIIKNSDLEELQELGSGTFGTVYHGKWRGSDVAIKRINDRIFSGKPSEQERARADFWNEACKLASLHHPNVVAFYGIVLDGPGGSIATVTEFMVNGSLRRALQKNEKLLDRRKRLLIAMDVAFGMEYLHSKNIIHFDLKSDNLLVNLRDPQRPICKVGDLGLSKVKYETLMSGGMQGTLPWMAPELLLGKDSKYTEKVDVFSFGIVLWELLTGEEPYKGMHCGAIIGGILSDTLRPPVPETCDPDWRSLMEQCWATEPSLRPSFTEIASRLRTMSTSLPQKG